jgi:hypothetical protein
MLRPDNVTVHGVTRTAVLMPQLIDKMRLGGVNSARYQELWDNR